MDSKVYNFKIILNGIEPEIWRRIHMSSQCTFADLDLLIKGSMGWSGCCQHKFLVKHPINNCVVEIVPRWMLGQPWRTNGENLIDESDTAIADFFTRSNDKGAYVYDIADEWEHTIHLEEIVDVKYQQMDIKICVGGEGLCPPEECGGVSGYYRLFEILRDPLHPEHAEMKRWITESCTNSDFYEKITTGAQFDPADITPVMCEYE